jgi:hypothetical protein
VLQYLHSLAKVEVSILAWSEGLKIGELPVKEDSSHGFVADCKETNHRVRGHTFGVSITSHQLSDIQPFSEE